MSRISNALEVAHENGVVHRDVKPENILLRDDGTPLLGDFDLVHARYTTGGTQTMAMGSIMYAAPEQNEDASRIDHRADVYSLGMTAVFCLCGKKLPMSVMYQRDTFLAALVCTPELRAVLDRAVALDPENRFASVSDFRGALDAARWGEGSSDTTARPEQAERADALNAVIAEMLKDEPFGWGAVAANETGREVVDEALDRLPVDAVRFLAAKVAARGKPRTLLEVAEMEAIVAAISRRVMVDLTLDQSDVGVVQRLLVLQFDELYEPDSSLAIVYPFTRRDDDQWFATTWALSFVVPVPDGIDPGNHPWRFPGWVHAVVAPLMMRNSSTALHSRPQLASPPWTPLGAVDARGASGGAVR